MRALRLAYGSEWVLEISFRGDAENSQSDYYYAKNNPVVHEGHQTVAAKVLEEHCDHYCAQYPAEYDSQHEWHFHVWRDATRFVNIPKLFQSRGGDGRSGKQKRKAGGRF